MTFSYDRNLFYHEIYSEIQIQSPDHFKTKLLELTRLKSICK